MMQSKQMWYICWGQYWHSYSKNNHHHKYQRLSFVHSLALLQLCGLAFACFVSLMATELFFFTPTPNLPLPLVKFPKHHQSLPLFSLAPPTVSSRFNTVSSSKARPSSSTVAVHAVREEAVQTPNSDSETTPASSSKLVLVVGGSGGVGTFWSFPFHDFVHGF